MRISHSALAAFPLGQATASAEVPLREVCNSRVLFAVVPAKSWACTSETLMGTNPGTAPAAAASSVGIFSF